jgi:NAD+-dependent protein deacetylase sirtuin 5
MCSTLARIIQNNLLLPHVIPTMATRQSSDVAKFREVLKSAKNVVFLSGAGISAESGIPTFRGAGGFWRKYQATSLASPGAFKNNPSLVWEFYHYRREVAAKSQPNAVSMIFTSPLS